jgi:hypothetical protein
VAPASRRRRAQAATNNGILDEVAVKKLLNIPVILNGAPRSEESRRLKKEILR